MLFNKSTLFIIILSLSGWTLLFSQKFPCDGSFYISQNTSGSRNTTLEKIVLNGSNATFERVAIYPLFINAIGFNPVDYYIYAIEKDTRQIIRIHPNGNFNKIGIAEGLQTPQSIAGAFTSNGIYIIQDINSSRLLFYELEPEVRLIRSIEHRWADNEPLSGVYHGVIADFAIHPYDPDHLFFHVQNTSNSGNPQSIRGKLARININPNSVDFGRIFTTFKVPDDVILQIGSMFFGSDGNLYGYGSKVQPLRQRNLVRINSSTGESKMIATGPVSQNSDGCSCPVKLDLTKSIIDHYRSCDTLFLKYRFRLVNQGINGFDGLTLFDELPLHSSFLDLNNQRPIWGDGTIYLSQNRRLLTIENFSINADDTFTLSFWVQYTGADNTFQNQAYISGFTGNVDNIILSDDPTTESKPDPTIFETDMYEFPVSKIDTTVCYGERFILNDSIYESSGSFRQLLPNSSFEGCDSLIELELTIAPRAEYYADTFVCFNEQFIFDGENIDASGVYRDTLINFRGCDSFISMHVTVSPTLSISGDTVYYDQEKCVPVQSDLNINFTADSVFWSPSRGLSCQDCLNPEIQTDRPIEYLVHAIDSFGCQASTKVRIIVNDPESPNYHIPNVFTPTNRDDINDHFTLFSNDCIESIEQMSVYDRWGNLLFEANNIPPNVPSEGWDGYFKGSIMARGTFVYHIRARMYDGTVATFSGDINLL